MRYVETRDVPVGDLDSYPGNARLHAAAVLEESARTNGQYRAIVARRHPDGRLEILAGHGTRQAFAAVGSETVRVEVIECDDAEARRIVLVDNRGNDLAAYDEAALLALLEEAAAFDPDLLGTGWDEAALAELLGAAEAAGEGGAAAPGGTPLAERYGVPPFSVLNARGGEWQARKHEWIALGLTSGMGRGDDLLRYSRTASDPAFYDTKAAVERKLGRQLTTEEFLAEHYDPSAANIIPNTSIFDPVLCEIAYRWFTPAEGSVLDPFAGGSVRGIVAAALGRAYTGIDLSASQVAANREQAAVIVPRLAPPAPEPTWICGDSTAAEGLLPAGAAYDFVFSCPPYADLERYSDDPGDLSTMDYPAFRAAHAEVIRQAVARLRPDRFAVWVIGEVRAKDRNGSYVGFVPDTIDAFRAAGCDFYGEAILVTAVGSLAIRSAKIFDAGRKLGKAHQNVLIFVKGDAKAAAAACAPAPAVELPLAEEGDD